MKIDFEKSGGLVPAIVQDATTGRVLMLAMMNQLAWEMTVETKKATFFSRSRNKLWVKGEQSGHTLEVVGLQTDCDQDAILVQVNPTVKGVCHEGYESCFFRTLEDGEWQVTEEKVYDEQATYEVKP
ncbi:MAG: phosphoribosyl-AMP cyclohydrolase [Fimbriimonadaceae bacterium]|nr:MAG: phosphoribosyl-AMP cyclohydrolase [Fimbriimonadaceae bacterium]